MNTGGLSFVSMTRTSRVVLLDNGGVPLSFAWSEEYKKKPIPLSYDSFFSQTKLITLSPESKGLLLDLDCDVPLNSVLVLFLGSSKRGIQF